MTKKQIAEAAKQEQIAKLREWMPKGSTVYTILRHISSSGMSRDISLVIIKIDDGKPYTLHPNYSAAQALGWPQSKKNDAIRVGGCGMDMGFRLVYTLSSVIHGDGYALKQEWL